MGGNRKVQKQGAARSQTPIFRRTPTPPTPWRPLFDPSTVYNLH